MTVECIGYKSHESGALKGFANFRMTMSNGMAFELFGCGIFMKDGRRWAGMPSREYQEDGAKKYISIFRFCEKPHTEAFCKAALQALDTWCSANAQPEPAMPNLMTGAEIKQSQAPAAQDDLPF